MEQKPKKRSAWNIFNGVMYLLTAIICMAMGTFMLGKLSDLANNPNNLGTIDLDAMPRIFSTLIERPMLYALICLPALISGIMLLAGARPRIFWNVLGLVGSLIMIGTIFASFIYLLAPLYQYQPL